MTRTSKTRMRNTPMTRRLTALVAAAGLLTLAGCSGSAASTAAGSTTLTVATTADARSLWPHSYTAQNEINISEQITEKLIEFSADSKDFEPRLATKWDQLDPKTVRLTLRQNVVFTNGEVFDANSAKKSIDIMLAAPTYQAYTKSISEAVVVDDHTLDIVSKEPSGLILMALAMGSFQYPAEYWDQVGEEGFGTEPIGTGPYTLAKWTKGVDITLTANENYWGGGPDIETLVFQVINDPAAQVAALQSGQVQFISDIPIGSIDSLKKDSSVEVTTRPSNRVFYVGLSSLDGSTLTDPDVRQALASAIDVESLIANQLDGYGTPLENQLLPPGAFGFDTSRAATSYDPEKAKSQLAAAGKSDLKIQLNYPSGRYAQDKELGQAISSQLERVGITVEQRVLEPGTFFTDLVAGKLGDAYFAGLLLPPDAHLTYTTFAEGAPFSYGESLPQVNDLMAKDAATADSEEREGYLHQITELLAQDPPYVPLFQGEDIYGTTTTVKGFEPRGSQFVDFSQLSMD